MLTTRVSVLKWTAARTETVFGCTGESLVELEPVDAAVDLTFEIESSKYCRDTAHKSGTSM